jgi:hypothetical protein
MSSKTQIKQFITSIVKEVLQEKTRGTFDLNHFKTISNANDLYSYARNTLGEPIGEGSSRIVFVLSSGKALKLARIIDGNSQKGQAQNEMEVDTYTNPKLKPIVAKIYDYHPEFFWIISELTKPLKYDQVNAMFGGVEFDDLLMKSIGGANARNYDDIIKHYLLTIDTLNQKVAANKKEIEKIENDLDNHVYDYDVELLQDKRKERMSLTYSVSYAQRDIQNYQELIENIEKHKTIIKPFLDGITNMKKLGMNMDDSLTFSQYGFTPDGRIIMIDYGWSDEVGIKHYGKAIW